MLTVDDYGAIRRARREGLSIREIARRFHHGRWKVRAVLREAEPRPYTRTGEPPAPVLDPVKPIIDQMLAADEAAPRKQRHTAAQMHRRLVAEHDYPGGYDQVRRYVARRRKRQRETFIPLAHDPGQRVEVDFGHIEVDFPAGRRPVAVLVLTWAYSHHAFAMAMPTERMEAVLAGMVAAFEFFGCVPREVWWDNPKTVVKEVLKGRERRVNERYAALASHYVFEPLFCLPAQAQEKPDVEHRIYDLQRRWATPVPQVKDFDDLNVHLRRCCLAERERTVAGQTETIGQRFEADRAAALPVPPRPFDPCILQAGTVDKYQTVAFDRNRYSVPRPWAFESVLVKGYVDRVEVVAGGHVIARHGRSYGAHEQILDPLHYLVVLGRRPAALDHSRVYRNWHLPADFADLRTGLEARHGASAGARQYIRVLQLLATHPVSRVRQAIERCLRKGLAEADAIQRDTERLAVRQEAGTLPGEPAVAPPAAEVRVPPPDLRHFNQLLYSGDLTHDRCQCDPVAEVEPATAAAAGDGG